jgi:hypothetical protein
MGYNVIKGGLKAVEHKCSLPKADLFVAGTAIYCDECHTRYDNKYFSDQREGTSYWYWAKVN